jgi:dihydrofolate reductase
MTELSILYTASLDGFIATPTDETPFSSSSWDYYRERLGRFQTLVMGRRTYELFCRDTSIEASLFKYIFVLSRTLPTAPRNGTIVCHSIAELSTELQNHMIREALVLGGSQTVTAVTIAGMVSTLTVLIEPCLLGSGVPLFCSPLPSAHLSLREVRGESGGFIVAEYSVANDRIAQTQDD